VERERLGVELSPEVEQVTQGRVPWYELRHLAGPWATASTAMLTRAAPWLLAAAARDRGSRTPLRLFGLGGQTIARKPGLFLSGREERPRLEIHWSSGNTRLPLVEWHRPADYELLRHGLLDEDELTAIARDLG